MQFPKYVVHAKNIIDLLDWKKPNIMGHSMGAGVSTLLAGSFPEDVNKLVLIEMLGPNSSDPEKTADVLKKAVVDELKFFRKKTKPKEYDFQGAIDARIASVKKYPGKQSLSPEASLRLIQRYNILDVTYSMRSLESLQ